MEVILVTCAVIFSDKRVLCALRSETMHLSGFWEFPGGKIEGKESPEDCLIREIREELAISIRIISAMKSNEHSYTEGKVLRLMPFACTWESGNIDLLEHEQVRWLTKEELKSVKWAPADLPIVEDLIGNWNNIQEQLVDWEQRKIRYGC
ncbi:(deoxy)nucleoside triphosphate pyrophosphohydrolase [Algoriphagus sp. Y33]|uniref:(deoxy)nucleoside triphosphate pyrophosphohydrolase n=1 Tax=Algoriphagus sp. Y33 TaxID=2772483 RepID=UPI0017808149|nr:(deoxy)nucleoside triphosphate pyrophosphohydrolase [Algoriphagus sp. Y33]